MAERAHNTSQQTKPKPQPKLATVVGNFSLTPNIIRIFLQSDAFKTFTADDIGAYVKLLFNAEGGTQIDLNDANNKTFMRTYTIAKLDPEQGIIGLDFMKHGDFMRHGDFSKRGAEHAYPLNPEQGGYAIAWALNAKEGDQIYIGGPGRSNEIDFNAEQCIFVADMTAIPALMAQLDKLDENAQGDVVLQLLSMDDMPALALPKGVNVHVILSDLPFKLAQTVSEVELKAKDLSIWCACEFTAMKAIRAYFSEQGLVNRNKSYFSSYWKQGVTEDGHKIVKREDAKVYTRHH